MKLHHLLKSPCFPIVIVILTVFLVRPLAQYPETKTDRAAYEIGAKMLASGKIYLPSPPQSFDTAHCVNRDGRFYSRYFPGTLLIGALGYKIFGTWFFLNTLAVGGVLLLLYYLGLKMSGYKLLGLLPLAFAGIFINVPLEVFAFHSVIYSTFFTLLFVWFFYRGIEEERCKYWLLAGFAIGYSAVCRPILPVFLILIAGFLLLLFAFRQGKKGWLNLLAFTFPIIILLTFQLFYNYGVTGNLKTFPFDMYDPHSSMGFGLKGDNFSGMYKLFTPFDIVRQFRLILWGALGVEIPFYISLFFLGWGSIILFSRSRSAGNANPAKLCTVILIAAGTVMYILMMTAHWCGLYFRHYFLEVTFFTLILISMFAGWCLDNGGKTVRSTIVAILFAGFLLSLFETGYGFGLSIKYTRKWKEVQQDIAEIAEGEKTLFIIHKSAWQNEDEAFAGGRWRLGSHALMYLTNPIDYDSDILYAVSLNPHADSLLIDSYKDERQIKHITVEWNYAYAGLWVENKPPQEAGVAKHQ